MQLDEFDQVLRATLDDVRLSRSEKRALSEVLADLPLEEHQLAVMRHHAFDMVLAEMDHSLAVDCVSWDVDLSRHGPLLDWLEEVMKVLSPPATPPSGGVESHAYFSPDDNVARVIINLFEKEHQTIDICVFTITDDRIARAILKAHRRGCQVRVVTDQSKATDLGSDIEEFRQAGIPVRCDRSEHHMHHKFAIFDNATLVNGSYNWTRNAALFNEENLIVTSDPSLVHDFRKTFERLWKEFE